MDLAEGESIIYYKIAKSIEIKYSNVTTLNRDYN
jgi:hypothetical protein